MAAFLLISTLSVAFYLVVLFALHRDSGVRQRNRFEQVRVLRYGGDEHRRESWDGSLTDAARRPANELQWLPVTKVYWRRVPQPSMTAPHRVVPIVGNPARGN